MRGGKGMSEKGNSNEEGEISSHKNSHGDVRHRKCSQWVLHLLG